ncbi:PTS system mannose/fructose/N-acetylgalactosamine-transporter subunit IIB [Pelolinea submarina]|uniref:PTS system N-acetylgalactosamine-specific IIB component/PTS system mannose-specific IIB component n=1 Tax=Pelolinea submarina TaxID=913107 RepID=A0A347ZQU3_9CHLR|nr:PTS sugar transporter subunit IIB [Pelolinea submarina]REG11771.1 PTS system N-acetylgalactosamine-specific IIB component/PTS system mannose-specific IIB component [Pelolinea submarina]BBB47674.1 PTS system, sorbose-specific IIB component [Pelolinea submarina]
MGKISLIRIDDRLIHGQVTTAWLRVYNANTIIIANERVATSPVYKSIFSVATVPGKEILLMPPAEAADFIMKSGPEDSFFIITPTPLDVVVLMDQGLDVKKINVGGLQGRPNTKKLAKVVYATSEEEQAFKELKSRGVEMEVQMVPTDRVTSLTI